MSKLLWDQVGERKYETGVDHGALYLPDSGGAYSEGYAWNGLTTVTESPSGADATPQYADNIKYLNLIAAEEFGGTIEAFTYPDEFAQCDGTSSPSLGISVGQQRRKMFGLSYRTLVGNDVDGTDYGYKLHLVYGALAAPSEKARATVNDSPEAVAFSWQFTTTAVAVEGTDPNTGKPFKPSATITLDSSKVDAGALSDLEDVLYGTSGADARLPLPDEVFELFAGTVNVVTPTPPTYVASTHTITIPTTAGVVYKIDGATKAAGPVIITKNTIVAAVTQDGYVFAPDVDTDWGFTYAA